MKRLFAVAIAVAIPMAVVFLATTMTDQGVANPRGAIPAAERPVAAPDRSAAAPAAVQDSASRSEVGARASADPRFHPLRLNVPMDAASVKARLDSAAHDVVCPGKEPCGP